ncbi:hypothetical protein MalM25_02210 [Planctomycetes bacterium MalM25]|nr:hypothetical protein MalM25_02210 [Planctomycetes bacterium MalM25]
MTYTVRLAIAALTLLSLAPASAQTNRFRYCQVEDPAVPAGYVANEILIDFEGRLFGQQMIVRLDSGSIYQDPFGGETPPNALLFNAVPSLEFDTFVTMGGATSDESEPLLVIGASTEFTASGGMKQFDESGINIAWAPATGVVVEDRTRFPIARLTLSNDANGTILLYSNAGGEGVISNAMRIENGGTGPLAWPPIDECLPEPTSAAIALLASLALSANRRSS